MKKIMELPPLDRVVIVGMGNSGGAWVAEQYRNPFDYSDPRQQVWLINNAIFAYRGSMGIFMDDLKDEKEVVFRSLDAIGLPVVTSRAYDEWKCAYDYPIKDVIETLNDTYLVNSIAYAVALFALNIVKHKPKAPRIELYGCDFNYQGSNPWESGRGCVEWWLRHVKHLGAEIVIPIESLLMDAAKVSTGRVLYGYHNPPEVSIVDGRYKVIERPWVEPPDEGNVRVRTPEAEVARDAKLAADAPKGEIRNIFGVSPQPESRAAE